MTKAGGSTDAAAGPPACDEGKTEERECSAQCGSGLNKLKRMLPETPAFAVDLRLCHPTETQHISQK